MKFWACIRLNKPKNGSVPFNLKKKGVITKNSCPNIALLGYIEGVAGSLIIDHPCGGSGWCLSLTVDAQRNLKDLRWFKSQVNGFLVLYI